MWVKVDCVAGPNFLRFEVKLKVPLCCLRNWSLAKTSKRKQPLREGEPVPDQCCLVYSLAKMNVQLVSLVS